MARDGTSSSNSVFGYGLRWGVSMDTHGIPQTPAPRWRRGVLTSRLEADGKELSTGWTLSVDRYGSLVAWATLTWIILDRLGLTWICLIGVALAGIALARIALARIVLTASRVVTHRCILFDCREDGAGGAESKDELVRARFVPNIFL